MNDQLALNLVYICEDICPDSMLQLLCKSLLCSAEIWKNSKILIFLT